jgi:hypothetical protein
MLSNKCKINEVDKYIYVRNINKCYVIVYLSMDDLLILENNEYITKSTKKILINKFNMKVWGVADIIPRMKIYMIVDDLVLFKSYYIEKILGKLSDGDNNVV